MAIYQEAYDLAAETSAQVDIDKMWVDLEAFSKLHRYTGSEAGEQAVDLICSRLEEYGVEYERVRFDVYRSLPKGGHLSVFTPDGVKHEFNLTPFVYSAECKNLRAPLYFDEMGRKKGGELQLFDTGEAVSTQKSEAKRFSDEMKGKIVFTLEGSYDFAEKARRAGAVGIVCAYALDIVHHGTLGAVWGNPTLDDLYTKYPWLPFGEVKKSDSDRLLELVDSGVELCAEMDIAMDNNIVNASEPVAFIKGKTDKYILISGHYDSWYEGMTDNAVANITMLEIARILKKYEGKLNHSVKLAWWCGHSDGRYAGSTYYSDSHYVDLHDNCIAHLNMDIAGFGKLGKVAMRTSALEKEDFVREICLPYNDEEPEKAKRNGRSGDMTFWCNSVPLAASVQFGEYGFGKPDYYYWHSPADGIDKLNRDSTLRDARFMTSMCSYYIQCKNIPVDFSAYVEYMKKELEAIDAKLAPEFDLSPVWAPLEKVRNAADTVMVMIDGKDTDDLIKKAGGELVRLTYSRGSAYSQDEALPQPIFPGIAAAKGKTRDNTSPDYFLALRTSFMRQVNRMTVQLGCVRDIFDRQIEEWSK
ncbi:MAG: M28 family peptidase [Firmicutes bacterium]|nr:M28 family peptidase [Bacillota bacterium]